MLLADVAAAPAADSVRGTIEKWNEVLQNSFNQAFHNVIEFTPRVVAMVVVLVVGYIAASLIGRIVTLLCEKIGLQRAAEHSGLAQSMQHMGIKRNVAARGRHNRVLAVDVHVLDGGVQHSGTHRAVEGDGDGHQLHSEAARGDGGGCGRAIDRELPPGRDRDQC